MKIRNILFILITGLSLVSAGYGAEVNDSEKKRILVVDSYHKGYNWSNDTNNGFTAAMMKYGYFDNEDQISEFNNSNYTNTSKAVIKKLWMDTKRQKSKEQRVQMTVILTKIAREFHPDLVFLGDDNAARYIGGQFLDTEIPVVFWGINNTPVKYGLLDSEESPGHNVTGIYQSGYYIDGLKLLKKLAPKVKTFAVLSDESPTGRSMVKRIQHLSRKGELPLKLTEAVSTDNYEEWKTKVLELQRKVDAFFIAQYNALKDETDAYVPNTEVAKWYLANVKIPEAAIAGQFVRQGMLCTADDSGYNQGYDAVVIAHDILANGANPKTYPPQAPKRGPLTVNKQRAEMLGIKLTDEMGIEKYIDKASVLKE